MRVAEATGDIYAAERGIDRDAKAGGAGGGEPGALNCRLGVVQVDGVVAHAARAIDLDGGLEDFRRAGRIGCPDADAEGGRRTRILDGAVADPPVILQFNGCRGVVGGSATARRGNHGYILPGAQEVYVGGDDAEIGFGVYAGRHVDEVAVARRGIGDAGEGRRDGSEIPAAGGDVNHVFQFGGFPGRALFARVALLSRRPLFTRGALFSGRPLFARGALFSRRPLFTRGALFSGRPLLARGALFSGRPLFTLRSLLSGRALDAGGPREREERVGRGLDGLAGVRRVSPTISSQRGSH